MKDDYLFTDSPFAHFTRRTFLGVLLTAIVASILTFVLTMAIDKVVLQPVMCQVGSGADCNSSQQIAYHISSIIAGIVAVVMLVQASVYRPLLVVLSSAVSLWSIYEAFLAGAPWPLQLLSLVVLNSITFIAFAWLLRAYNFAVALVSSFVLVVVTLLVTNA